MAKPNSPARSRIHIPTMRREGFGFFIHRPRDTVPAAHANPLPAAGMDHPSHHEKRTIRIAIQPLYHREESHSRGFLGKIPVSPTLFQKENPPPTPLDTSHPSTPHPIPDTNFPFRRAPCKKAAHRRLLVIASGENKPVILVPAGAGSHRSALYGNRRRETPRLPSTAAARECWS